MEDWYLPGLFHFQVQVGTAVEGPDELSSLVFKDGDQMLISEFTKLLVSV